MGAIKNRVTAIIDDYLSSYDLIQFANQISDASAWFGRFGKKNRITFLEELETELTNRL